MKTIHHSFIAMFVAYCSSHAILQVIPQSAINQIITLLSSLVAGLLTAWLSKLTQKWFNTQKQLAVNDYLSKALTAAQEHIQQLENELNQSPSIK